MVFLPVGCLIFGLFILFFPIILMMLFFNAVTFSFERLGISPHLALVILFMTLVGSLINIPVTKRTVEYSRQLQFGWFRIPVQRESGLAINLGGAIIPAVLSGYLLTKAPLLPVVVSTALLILICKFLARPIPGRGLAIPMFIPPLFSTLFSVVLAGDFAAPVAYISGVLGTLIGGEPSKSEEGKEIRRRSCLHRWCWGI